MTRVPATCQEKKAKHKAMFDNILELKQVYDEAIPRNDYKEIEGIRRLLELEKADFQSMYEMQSSQCLLLSFDMMMKIYQTKK